MRTRVFGLLLLMAGGIMFAQTSTTKSLSISVTAPPSPTGNLLTGKTPANYTLPSGWSVRCTEDFEVSGTVCTQGTGIYDNSMTVTTAQAHTGTKSNAQYVGSGDSGKWIVTLPSASKEVYVSWYERLDAMASGAGFYEWGGDFYKVNFVAVTGEQMTLNYCCAWSPNGYITTWGNDKAALIWQPQGGSGDIGNQDWISSKAVGFDGTWHQWEVHYKANTQAGGSANSDGVVEIWRDGAKEGNNYVNSDMNGLVNMAGMQVEIGGHYNSMIFLTTNITNYSQCSALIAANGPFYCSTGPAQAMAGQSIGCTDPPNGINLFDWINSKCPGQASAKFYKNIDDVIVLYK